ncbi:helix-turn-helix domain-containing protein [Paenibacillus pini]
MVLKTIEEIRIYSDPYRMNILERFQKAERPSTVKEIADKMGEVPAKVYYHARKLESIGLLKLVSTKQINGITAKYFDAFKGAVQISRSEMDTNMQTVFLSETQKLLSDLYDKSKQNFLDARSVDNPKANLINGEVYLTDEQAKEFFEHISAFLDKHRDKTSESQERYDIFNTIAKKTPEHN